jgi:RNA polymerase sigma factor (sigma-70 family)
MPTRTLTQIASHLRREAIPLDAAETDRDLLTRFLIAQDEAAFESLVRRHDRLVRSAISKVLSNAHDAEDAFQATFLVLVRRSKSIDWRVELGPWLYGVAHRVAVKARDASRMRSRKEKQTSAKPGDLNAGSDLSWREACALLHAELDKLPDHYRLPLLLCYLEGKTRDEAAATLQVTTGTVKGRLERGREILRNRLARRGVTLSAGLFSAVASESVLACSSSSIAAVLEAVRGPTSPRILTLTQETAMSTILSKFTRTATAILGLTVIASAVIAASSMQTIDAPDEKGKVPTPPSDVKPAEQAPKQPPAPAAPVMVTIKGHLIGSDKAPEPGATVAVWANGKKLGETTTTKFQMFQVIVPGPLPSDAKVVATKPDFAPDWTNVPADPEKTPVELQIGPDDGKIAGRVTNLEDQPVANLLIVIDRIGRPKPGKTIDDHIKTNSSPGSLNDLDSIPAEVLGLPTRVTTDKDGHFTIAGVGKDRVVRIITRGETTEHIHARIVTREIDEKLITPGPRGVYVYGATGTLRLRPSRPIVGSVHDAKTGDPVPGLRVTDASNYLLHETTTDKDGKFKIIGVGKQPQYSVTVSSLNEMPYFDHTLRLEDSPGLGEIVADFKVHRGIVVTGQVVDSSGKPVAGQVHHVWTTDNPFLKEHPGFEERGRLIMSNWGELDRNGRYKLLAIPGPGVIDVRAQPEDLFPRLGLTQADSSAMKVRVIIAQSHAVATVNIDPNDPKTLTRDFTLTPGKSRELIVRGIDGKLPDKLLVVGQRDRGQPIAPKPITGDTIKLTGLSPKQARAAVFIDAAQTVGAVASVTDEAETPFIVTLEKLGSVTGRVFDSDGNPAANADVRLWLLLERAEIQLTEQAIAALKKENVPEMVLSKLTPLNGKVFLHNLNAVREVNKVLGADDSGKYESLIVKHAVHSTKYDNLPMEIFTYPGANYFGLGAWNDFTSRTAKTDKDGRFTLKGLLPGQPYHFIAGFNLKNQRDGELLNQRIGLSVKPGETLDLGDLKYRK